MILGYIIGLSCLFLVTYRTLIAFFSESNAVIIYINKFGEQFIDIFILVIFWIICLIGLVILFKFLKEENVSKNFHYKFDKSSIIKQDNSFFDIDNIGIVKTDNKELMRILPELSDNIKQNLNLDD